MRLSTRGRLVLALVLPAPACVAYAQETDAGLAQELTNPLANLVTVPVQMSFDRHIGPADDGHHAVARRIKFYSLAVKQEYPAYVRRRPYESGNLLY